MSEPTTTPPQSAPATCSTFDHEWEDEYYGFRCKRCRLFVPPDYFDPPTDPETCRNCGKELEDFSALGCELCDARVRDADTSSDKLTDAGGGL